MPETPSQRPNTLPLAADPAPGPRHIPRGLLRTRPAATHDTFGEAHQIRPPHPTIPLTTSISTYPYNYPPLLPPPIRNASTAPYDHVLLSRVTATLRGAPADEFDLPHEVTRAFIALCHYNLLHLAIADDAQQIQERLEHMPGNELVLVARTVQLGISDCMLLPAPVHSVTGANFQFKFSLEGAPHNMNLMALWPAAVVVLVPVPGIHPAPKLKHNA